MKIITKTTFVVGKGKTVEPGQTIELDDQEALGLIERGLAEPLPTKAAAQDNADANNSAGNSTANGAAG